MTTAHNTESTTGGEKRTSAADILSELTSTNLLIGANGEPIAPIAKVEGEVDPRSVLPPKAVDEYEWHDLGALSSGGVLFGSHPDEFLRGSDLQIAKRSADDQLLVRHKDSEAFFEVRNLMRTKFKKSAADAARTAASFLGFDSTGNRAKFAQSDYVE